MPENLRACSRIIFREVLGARKNISSAISPRQSPLIPLEAGPIQLLPEDIESGPEHYDALILS